MSEKKDCPIKAKYRFNEDELRVLHECKTESFYQRSLPLSTTFGLAAYLGVKRGVLTPNAKYGAVPKVILAAMLGYFVGKWSYRQKCAEKLMALPDSKFGEMLRHRKHHKCEGGFFNPQQSLCMGMPFGPFNLKESDVHCDKHLHPDNKNKQNAESSKS
ncbi:OCIA domain-containing protein 1-like [Stomoxys calcitrans]|uniref:OCIA domain-containing protein n=1 Tax=Stomoxys calcitrans TaxID=35570 RepID=A0A1I8PA71_STOCA|nr:OCIA domain-containing protein 1-like [Stomoxys calcitrans]